MRPSPMSPIGMTSISVSAMPLPCAHSISEGISSSWMEWAHGKGMALTLIEVMPMGEIGEGRIDQYLPLSLVRARLAQHYTLSDLDDNTGGPARHGGVGETRGNVGLITPMTRNIFHTS